MGKLTPEQAWPHLKALEPNATHISHDEFGSRIHFKGYSGGLHYAIDWPDGMTRYPPEKDLQIESESKPEACKSNKQAEKEIPNWAQACVDAILRMDICGTEAIITMTSARGKKPSIRLTFDGLGDCNAFYQSMIECGEAARAARWEKSVAGKS